MKNSLASPRSTAIISSIIRLPFAIFFSLLILRTLRAGGNSTAHPANLVLMVAVLAALIMVAGGIIADQYPC